MTTCSSVIVVALILSLLGTVVTETLGHALGKRSIDESADANTADYPDYEYQPEKPMAKRAALLLDRLLVALQKAVENEKIGNGGTKSYVRSMPDYSDTSDSNSLQLSDEKTMDLQRRGQAKGRVYWRCYFNAVTCFRRK